MTPTATAAPPAMPPKTRPNNSSSKATQPQVEAPALGMIEPKFQPPRIIVNAVEGWGKTSLGAHAPKAAILMGKGETGYETLLGTGLVPQIPAARIETWAGFLALLDSLAEECPHKTLVLDAMASFEQLCHEHVCIRDFDGDWGEKGFSSYQKGYCMSANEWIGMLAKLDRISGKHGVMVILLSHSAIRSFQNPTGPDFSQYAANVHVKTWGPTVKWADAVLFGNFLTITDKGKGERKHRGIGGTDRIVYTERCDAWEAKNRYGMAPEIDIPNDPAESFKTVWAQITNRLNKAEK